VKIPFRNSYLSKRKSVTPAKAAVQKISKSRYDGTIFMHGGDGPRHENFS
jgi:hypothetical protein